jgi:prophage maintenance system killer protein
MRYLSFEEIIALHAKVAAQSGRILGVRDRGVLESAVARPEMTLVATLSTRQSPRKLPR